LFNPAIFGGLFQMKNGRYFFSIEMVSKWYRKRGDGLVSK
jgi:hypothetical protein